MRVFIPNYTYLEKGAKGLLSKSTCPKGSKSQFANLNSSRTMSVLILGEKYLIESLFGKQYFTTLW